MNEDDLFTKLCSYENLELAFKKARKGKTLKPYVLKFEEALERNLLVLRSELLLLAYRPQPLKTFILREPKTRKISVSLFRDRIVHHAVVQVLEPIFGKCFIYDSYASRIGKGTLAALKRFDDFKRKVSHNNTKNSFILKADIRHYFETVDHCILLDLIRKKISDQRIIFLIKQILNNHSGKEPGKGMPLGSHTSQFFANLYLHELDNFAKNQLKAKFYLRYMDDFVILHNDVKTLAEYKKRINDFLKDWLNLELHPDKSQVIPLERGISLLGFRVFYHHRLLLKKRLRHLKNKYFLLCQQHTSGKIDYDEIYNFMEGWIAYAKQANNYNLRKNILASFEEKFKREVSTKEINRGFYYYFLVLTFLTY